MQWRCWQEATEIDVRSIYQMENSEVARKTWEENLNPKSSLSPMVSDNASYWES